MKTRNNIKLLNVMAMIAITVAMFSCEYDDFNITDTPFVEFTSVDLFIGENAGSHSMKQVNVSPGLNTYVFTSLEPEVASVTQSGLIKAVGEGFATITVASKNDATNIYVWVRPWVPVDDITLSTYDITRDWNGCKEMQKIDYVLYPANTTQTEVTWWSTNPEVASVMEHGWIVFNNKGTATIYASIPSGEIKAVTVNVGVDNEDDDDEG
ncbi:MAG: Ig-like domain-containing protein [Bacteroidales bacterium]|jgi:hypothetical protein|nr:Ig-like domain-containing protein [Bacteroidales bacterium]